MTTTESLGDFGKRLREAMGGLANGPLIMAKEVRQLADNWQAYQEESGGKSCTAWLKSVCGAGHGLAWWIRRADAVAYLGESCRRTTDHEVAVHVLGRVPKDQVKPVLDMLRRRQRENGGVPITLAMARLELDEMIGKPTKPKRTCGRCRQLERQLIELGFEPVK